MVVEASLAAARLDPRLLQLERARREEELDSLRSEVSDLRARYDAAAGSAADDVSSLAETRHRLDEAESTLVAQLTTDLDEYRALADEFARENDDLRVRAGAAERERDYLRGEVSRLRAGERPSDEVDDSTAALLAEIDAEIRERGEIDGARRRVFTLAPQFVPIMEAHGARYRSKIVKACADIAIGAPALLSRRDDHSLREGDGGNDPVRIRERDGAEARRCYIEHRTAAARRVHYWVTPDGAIEFASVNVHDDMNIPE